MRFPRPTPRAWLSACVLMLSVLSGCKDEPVADPTSSDAGPEAPPAWDGTYTELEEHGDWEDRGRYAPCDFNSQGAPTEVSCEDLSRFNLSGCDPDALASIGDFGVYHSDVRTEARLADGGTRVSNLSVSFKLEADGGGTLNDGVLRTRLADGGTFFLSSERTSPVTGVNVIALAGCKVPSPGIITGCYARCRNGRFSLAGTFEAHRMTWAQGEPESSGGMRMLSESPIAASLGKAVDIYVHKDHAYVVSSPDEGASPAGGLTVFDVKDREHPVLKTSVSIPGDHTWNGVWAKGDALYVASAASGVIVYDISNPGAPEYVRGMPIGSDSGAHTVLVDGDRLYAMSGGSLLHIFDVSQPLAPVLRQSITAPQDGVSGAHDAFAYEGRLYISNSNGGYSVMDVTDLDNIRHLGQYVHGEYAHHSAVGTFAGRTIAFEGTEFNGSHMRVLDVTDPARIVKIGQFKMRPVTSVHNMLLKGNRLYVAWYHEGVRVLDVSNPTQPRQVAHFNTYRDNHPKASDYLFEGTFGIRVPGDGFVYAADSLRGLLIFNEP